MKSAVHCLRLKCLEVWLRFKIFFTRKCIKIIFFNFLKNIFDSSTRYKNIKKNLILNKNKEDFQIFGKLDTVGGVVCILWQSQYAEQRVSQKPYNYCWNLLIARILRRTLFLIFRAIISYHEDACRVVWSHQLCPLVLYSFSKLPLQLPSITTMSKLLNQGQIQQKVIEKRC
jgi:hypothetical protein